MSHQFCPYCFNTTDDYLDIFLCKNRNCKPSSDVQKKHNPENIRILPASGMAGNCFTRSIFSEFLAGIGIANKEEGSCPSCKQKSQQKVCKHCKMPIPISGNADASIIVSILGTPGAGKSTWLAATIQELSANIGPVNGFDFQPVGELTRAHYRKNYYEPIYVRNEKIPPSDRKGIEEIHNPLVYSFTHQDSGQSATIIFLDVAGEDLNDVEYMAQSLKYIHRSDVILHLIDLADIVNEEPRAISVDVAGQAQNSSAKITLNSMSSSDILARIYELHTSHGAVSVGEKVAAPLGIIAAKIDKHVETMSSLDFSESYTDRKIYENATIVKAFLFDSGVRGYLQSANNRFEDNTCFGVSSLGHDPDTGTGSIHPFGVTDPLVWALVRMNLLPGGE